jgi:hypothetical protein
MPWTDFTVPFTTGDEAFAIQISDEPNWVLERLTSVHGMPQPEIVSVCLSCAAVGPADAANATSSSSGPVVLKVGVVTVPVPSIDTVLSTVRAAGVPDPEETTSETELPVGTDAPAVGV